VSEQGLREISEGRRNGDGKGLREEQWVVIRYAEAMTRDIVVPDEVFWEVRRFLNDRQMVELTATVAAINCGARFLVALDVGEFDEMETGQRSHGSSSSA
jgi:alkylhydroperoxidase family enzyme